MLYLMYVKYPLKCSPAFANHRAAHVADHYKGLTRHFAAGTVYCTRETARLVRLKLGVRPCDALLPQGL